MYGAATKDFLRDFRSVQDVRDGIAYDVRDVSARMVEYRPRPGAAFCLVLTDLSVMPPQAVASLGRGLKSPWLVSVTNFGRSFVVDAGSGASWQSVRQALGCCVVDAVVLAELLGHLLGTPVETVDDYLRARGDLRA